MTSLRRVALLVETSRSYGRGVLRGIARYHGEQKQWLTYFQPHGLGDPPPAWLKHWDGHGVIARVDNQRTAAVLRGLRVPVINLRSSVSNLPFPFLGTDNQAVAELAANHLLEQGFRHFGFFELQRKPYPGFATRAHWFSQCVARAGYTCHIFQPKMPAAQGRGLSHQRQLQRWIKQLPKPVGIMAGNDDHGMQVLETCRQLKIEVPNQVAVIGVDNDEHLCNLSIPPLTSVELDCERIGYEAAVLLDSLMARRPAPTQIEMIKPRGIVRRTSTDVLAVEDDDVRRAITYIRGHACQGIRVSDVFRRVGVSRPALEAKLRAIFRRTIHQEIQRVQVERAMELLRDTRLPIKQIAHEAGFTTVQYMTRLFGKAAGETPARYRTRIRVEASGRDL
ncbi:MAG: DNA-binding transcriptional regulator [Singulisphaera sp.]